MKGLIALAKKNESISDKIVRLYKEGYSIPEIAKEMEMPKDNVPRILEKHFPDYASFEQPVREGADENGNGKKSVFNMSVSELFGKKNKKQENVEPAKVTVNLAMDDDGFVDHSVAAIASMLQKGRSVNDIAGFFNKDPEDIKAVQGCMDEHFKRMNTYKGPKVEPASEPKEEPAQNITDPLAASLASGIAKRKSNMYATSKHLQRLNPLPLLFLLRTIAFTLLLLRLSKRLRKKLRQRKMQRLKLLWLRKFLQWTRSRCLPSSL